MTLVGIRTIVVHRIVVRQLKLYSPLVPTLKYMINIVQASDTMFRRWENVETDRKAVCLGFLTLLIIVLGVPVP